jgi:hypothetical protein
MTEMKVTATELARRTGGTAAPGRARRDDNHHRRQARLDPGDHQPAAAATGLPAGVTSGISVHNPGAVTLVNWQQADHTS